MAKALITGISGFIGSHLVRRLLSDGWEVCGIVEPGLPITLVADLRDRLTLHERDGSTEGLVRWVGEARPDACFHLASQFLASHQSRDVLRLIDSNLAFGTQLAEALAAAGTACLVNVGTSWQHFEGRSYSPVALYAATKQAFQDILAYYDETTALGVVTLKFFDTYGAGDTRRKVLNIIHQAAERGESLGMTGGEQLIDLVYVDDIIEALLRGHELVRAGSALPAGYAVTSGAPLTLQALVDTYSRVTGRRPDIRWGELPYRRREMFTPWSAGPVVPGWAPRISLEEGLRRFVAGSREAAR